MDAKLTTKLVRVGNYAAEVEVRLIEGPGDWAPYLSLADAKRLDEMRAALSREDLPAAARLGRVFRLQPIQHA